MLRWSSLQVTPNARGNGFMWPWKDTGLQIERFGFTELFKDLGCPLVVQLRSYTQTFFFFFFFSFDIFHDDHFFSTQQGWHIWTCQFLTKEQWAPVLTFPPCISRTPKIQHIFTHWACQYYIQKQKKLMRCHFFFWVSVLFKGLKKAVQHYHLCLKINSRLVDHRTLHRVLCREVTHRPWDTFPLLTGARPPFFVPFPWTVIAFFQL